MISKTAEKRIVSWSNNTVGDTKRHGFHIVSVGIDITDRKIAEEEAELRKQQLLKADKMASLGVLASGIAHEINNPNNFIMMNAPIFRAVWNGVTPILDKYFDEYGDFTVANMRYTQMRGELPKLFDGIENGSERIRRIIKNMKNYSMKDRPKHRQPVNMNEVVAAAVSLLAHEIKKSTQYMVIRCSENLPFIQGSIHRLEQVMVNLIQNACQALTDQGKGITIETSLDKKGDEVVVSVIDEGIGIRAEHMGNIADPFFTTKSDIGGTGLGLSICANIVKEHNGRLEFTSEVEKGTLVRLSLPVLR